MDKNKNKKLAIGIDLGTTFSCVGVYRDGKVEIIANDMGDRTTPSFVGFTESQMIVGITAKDKAPKNKENTVFEVKRLMGRRYNDKVVQEDIKSWPFKVEKDTECDRPVICVDFEGVKRRFTPEQISANILLKMKETASSYLGVEVTDAVITVPAYFNDSQRSATKDAGKIAGLNVLRIINEPTAAAIAYGIDHKFEAERKVLIFDLGGGTFDVSVLSIKNGAFEVKSTNGNTHLGGVDFDNRLIDFCAKEILNTKKITLNKTKLGNLRGHCEKAKVRLSTLVKTEIDIDGFLDGDDFNITLSRAKFEDICDDLFKKCIPCLDNVLIDAKLKKEQIDDVVLVGGSTRIPKIYDMVKAYFNGKEPSKQINPDEAVAYGASYHAANLTLTKEDVKDIGVTGMILLDVTPLSVGIETTGGIMSTIIKKNANIPIKKEQNYTTTDDNQSSVSINIFEGEFNKVIDNNALGSFSLVNIKPMKKGVPQIVVTISIDTDGILKVEAVEKSSGVLNKITIKQDKNRLSPEDIEKHIKEAQRNILKDAKNKLREDLINKLEKKCYEMKDQTKIIEVLKWIKENPQAEKEEIERKAMIFLNDQFK